MCTPTCLQSSGTSHKTLLSWELEQNAPSNLLQKSVVGEECSRDPNTRKCVISQFSPCRQTYMGNESIMRRLMEWTTIRRFGWSVVSAKLILGRRGPGCCRDDLKATRPEGRGHYSLFTFPCKIPTPPTKKKTQPIVPFILLSCS